MTELLTSAQMRAIETAAIGSDAVSGLHLMERAGQGVVDAIFAEWPDLAAAPHRAVVLCGPGNNGGDGFVVARLLKALGWEVEVLAHGTPGKMPPDARVNYERWRGMGEVRAMPAPDQACDPWTTDLIIDALFGTGLTRPLSFDSGFGRMLPERDLKDFPERPKVVAVDVPSGLCADSGRMLNGDGLWADLTVTFQMPKIGHFVADGPSRCGRLSCVGIGLDVPGRGMPSLTEAPIGVGKGNALGGAGHKYSHGHALILSGASGKGGAARLAARGAIRIGAGLVTVGCPPAAVIENAGQLNAIMLKPVADAADLAAVLNDRRINALCLGPGLGVDRAAELVAAALRHARARPALVLDADALTALAADAALFAMLHDRCILTPHGGEFARLFPDLAARLAAPATTGPAYSKVDATRDAAARAGCVVLFKGADTVIAHHDRRCSINSAHYDRAAPWLATAGAGDVLAGFITGLLARGFQPMQAAETAAWLHVECARSFGPGLIAEDLPEALPKVFQALGL